MNGWLVLTHLLAAYAAFGAWLGYRLGREDGESAPLLLISMFIGAFIGPFIVAFDKNIPPPAFSRKTAASKAARTERKRMAIELAKERGAVEMIEASAEHRREMAALHERRRRAEEAP